ncbi:MULTISPECIES: hypothetical protein [Pseudomonadaceae]|jgi:hypothetical protein|uniref:Uncharacterized protein n=1 Tax=Stutzerimonas stutzeri TaxID=316 RepID=A0A172WPH1_STUST|nr:MULTISPECIES: hypothetical protein [Pseudomonadaceae]ANF25300.1 hypothetical protein PS273GM_09145 [Stutzerimonas stutzeri]MCQ4285763.1 hypothetical protein [Stutzerimonas stutzeri]BAP81653.1 beta-lactamase [Pseudomonas sp. MT-1]|tara:strand:- start:46 stop:378 length:333 start_codon:yes stop_codon:yes gene_type:complete
MIYSTGSSHLLSATLTCRTGKSTLQAPLDGFAISAWTRDPQGIYLGGNEMAMTPRSLLAFSVYRRGGLSASGERLLSQDWIKLPGHPTPARATPGSATAMAGSSPSSAFL